MSPHFEFTLYKIIQHESLLISRNINFPHINTEIVSNNGIISISFRLWRKYD
jgi:hypothetical protein